MIETDKLYSDAFFSGRNKYNWRSPIAARSIIKVYREIYKQDLRSTADLGCAIGDVVQGFLDEGIDAFGFEGSESARPHIICPKDRWGVWDLRLPIEQSPGVAPDFTVDLVTCFEVLEHLEPECAETAVQNLCCISDVLITSACPPNAQGRPPTKYHLNEQEEVYWNRLFGRHGYARHGLWERRLRAEWAPWRKKYGIAAWYQNLLVYTIGGV